MTTVLVSGGAGFIGNHLCRYLKAQGFWVRAADINPPAFGASEADDFMLLDLRDRNNCLTATRGVQWVFQAAASMGGMGFLHEHQADVLHDNALINAHMIEAARLQGVERYLFTSSACVYPEYRQMDADVPALKEDDAWPAQPDLAYGFEKLFGEELCRYYHKQYGMETRIARLHNVYGPMGTYQGGREKAPAALCRKVAEAKHRWSLEDGHIETVGGFVHDSNGKLHTWTRTMLAIDVWGDGEQTRSFCYVDNCVEGLYRLMQSDYAEPLNIGSSELVTINAMTDLIADIAGLRGVEKRHDLTKPQGVRGRNSDNTRIRDVLGWEPSTSLAEGLKPTYEFVEEQVRRAMQKVAA